MNYYLDKTKRTIELQVRSNDHVQNRNKEISKFYYWTNESIQDYFKLFLLKKDFQVLAVLGSGDQMLSLLSRDVLNIDTFDINAISERFVFDIKIPMILLNTYGCYKLEMTRLLESTNREEVNDIILSLGPFMSKEGKSFWQTIINYNYHIQKEYKTNINLFKMLSYGNLDASNMDKALYLQDEEDYNRLKNNLNKANLSFKAMDACEIGTQITKKYNLIMLSNVLDYFFKTYGFNWQVGKLNDYKNEIESLLEYNGTLFLHYIFYAYGDKPIMGADISLKEALDRDYHYHAFMDNNIRGMIYKRKK